MAIGAGWADGAWTDAGWITTGDGAWNQTADAPAVDVPFKGGGSSGRTYTWAPEELPKGDFTRRYEKTQLDDELERLLKEAIKREDLAKQAKKIAARLGDQVTAVQDIARAADHVGQEVLKLQQTHKISQEVAQTRIRKLKDEEDLIISLLLSEI